MLFCLPKLMAQMQLLPWRKRNWFWWIIKLYGWQVFYTNAVGSNGSINQGAQQPVEILH
jgi:hypothetical protein